MCFQLQPFSRLSSSSFSVRSDRFIVLSLSLVVPALVAGIHALLCHETHEDVEGRDNPVHDVSSVWSHCGSVADAMTNSGLPIRTTGTLRRSWSGASAANV